MRDRINKKHNFVEDCNPEGEPEKFKKSFIAVGGNYFSFKNDLIKYSKYGAIDECFKEKVYKGNVVYIFGIFCHSF